MNFSFTAQEAYDASVDNYGAELEKNKIELDSLIKKAVEKGQFSVIYAKETFADSTKAILNQLGYKVTTRTSDSGEKFWIISWERPGVI